MSAADDVVERVAQAIAGCDGVGSPLGHFPDGSPMRASKWEEFMPEQHEAWRNMARAAIAAMPGWQPAESAPKDGTRFLGVDGETRTVAWGKASHVPLYGFCLADQGPEDFDLCNPTHWQPLPAPP